MLSRRFFCELRVGLRFLGTLATLLISSYKRLLPDGELGELVFTSLTKEAMPVIRYRTRDLTRLLPGTARSMRRMAKITGRSDDMLIIRGVNVFPSQIEELILKHPELTPVYQLHIEKDGPMDKLDVYAELRMELFDKIGLTRIFHRAAFDEPIVIF